MNMVGCSARFQQTPLAGLKDATHIGIEPRPQFGNDKREPVFCAEDHVNELADK